LLGRRNSTRRKKGRHLSSRI
jgi:hypothetical protein